MEKDPQPEICAHDSSPELGTFRIIDSLLQIAQCCIKCHQEYFRDPTESERNRFEEIKKQSR